MQLNSDLAIRAHNGTSFSPEQRGANEVTRFNDVMQQVESKYTKAIEKTPQFESALLEQQQKIKTGIKTRWESYLYSRSNVMSAMITGPARFPTARNQKWGQWATNKEDELYSFINRVDRFIARATRVKTLTSKLSDAKTELQLMESWHLVMKESNKLLKSSLEVALEFLTQQTQNKSILYGFANNGGHNWWGLGFASFELTNSNARIKSKKELIQKLESREMLQDVVINGISITVHPDDDRLRINFDGKPSSNVIDKLKSNGFRWSPTNNAWQRQLTGAAMIAAKNICTSI